MKTGEPCICCSGKAFGNCCEPFLCGRDKPKTPKQLMRSRYSAYALGDYAYREYLIRTWHPHTAGGISLADLETPGIVWKRLEILMAEQKGDKGVVEFKAIYTEDGGPERTHHETSVFHRIEGEWFYYEGDEKETAS